jgi:hypothetical protein
MDVLTLPPEDTVPALLPNVDVTTKGCPAVYALPEIPMIVPGGPLLGVKVMVPAAETGVKGMAAASNPRIQTAENILKNLLNFTNYLPFLIHISKSNSKARVKL